MKDKHASARQTAGRPELGIANAAASGGLVVYKAPSGKCVIGVKPPNSNFNGDREVDERSPLIPGKHVPVDGKGNCEDTGSGCGLLRGRGTDITFLAILVCSFLSAFDFTVIAAIFPLMYVSPPSLLPSPD